MKRNTSFTQLFATARAMLAYKVERTIIKFTEQVIGKMDVAGISRTALAAKLEASPSYVTKFLRGDTNFTLESMVKVADALDCDLNIELASKTSAIDWFKRCENSRPKEKPEIRLWTYMTHMKTATAAARGGTMHVACPPPPQHPYPQVNPQDSF